MRSLNGLLTEAEAKAILVDKLLIPHNYDDVEKKINEQIDDYKVQLFESFFSDKDKLQKQINFARRQFNVLLNARHSLDEYTIERICVIC